MTDVSLQVGTKCQWRWPTVQQCEKGSKSRISTTSSHTDFQETCQEFLTHQRVLCPDEQCFEQYAAFNQDFLLT